MLEVTANRPIPLNLSDFTEFEQGYLYQGLQEFFRTNSHPHPRSQKLRTYPQFVSHIKQICTSFEQKAQNILAYAYEQGYSPWMAGSSFWDKKLYDVDDRMMSVEWLTLAHQFPHPQFILVGDILTLEEIPQSA